MKVLLRTTDHPDGFRADADLTAGAVTIDGSVKKADDLALLAPAVGRVHGILFNYRGALAEALANPEVGLQNEPYNGPPEDAVFYMKLPNTISSYGADIVLPYDCGTEELRIEASLGIVIGSYASRLTPENAMDAVAGYTIVCDATLPHTSYFRVPIRFRCRDGFCPMGPWMVDKKDLPDTGNLNLRVFIDGALKGSGSTSDWARSVPQLLSELTDIVSLCPGDVVMTGTPAKSPIATIGQKVRIEIDGLGALENTVALEKKTGGAS
ncbi:hypothetical protein FACS1894206_01980 [Deltaproteobacteria bacterium]|nr:hypothetical protein FACS1894206_01980 [Deltaproteobacteria bacterium]